jgi:hypothetical protein
VSAPLVDQLSNADIAQSTAASGGTDSLDYGADIDLSSRLWGYQTGHGNAMLRDRNALPAGYILQQLGKMSLCLIRANSAHRVPSD